MMPTLRLDGNVLPGPTLSQFRPKSNKALAVHEGDRYFNKILNPHKNKTNIYKNKTKKNAYRSGDQKMATRVVIAGRHLYYVKYVHYRKR